MGLSGGLPDAPGRVAEEGQEAAEQLGVSSSYPEAEVVPTTEATERVTTQSDTLKREGSHIALDGNVVLTYGDRRLEADHVAYDSDTGEATATGHILITGGPNQERIRASRGTLNLNAQTGEFFDVTGSVGIVPSKSRMVYANGNPFLFTGRRVVKRGAQAYDIYDGTVTSCQMPKPDWLLSAGRFSVANGKASAKGSVFRLLNVPLLYLPYVTHAVDAEDRQSGFMLPVLGNSSTKGIVLGEEFYLAINRSTDLTVGLQFFSLRGWLQTATLRFKGLGDDFVAGQYTGLQDRGINLGGTYVNQGGQDITFAGRHDFTDHTRMAADVEYLSSYVFREAFTESFNQAVSTDILSTMYVEHEADGFSESASADRYQGLKRIQTPTVPEAQVRIFHAPSLEFATTDHAVGHSRLEWNLDTTAAGLKRTEPNFSSSGIVERLDFHPQVALPLHAGGWYVRPSVGARDTLYSRSRVTPYVAGMPQESTAGLNRTDFEGTVDVRLPVLERTFDAGFLRNRMHRDFKHTIEPELTYRYVTGVNNFLNVLRFDATDVVSNTNELEYGMTQHVFVRPGSAEEKPCTGAGTTAQAATGTDAILAGAGATTSQHCGTREWLSWRVAQKYFFNPTFSGAVRPGTYGILQTTLDFSGVAFLNGPRSVSPVISRLLVRPSDRLDVEWNFDVDPVEKKFTADNLLVDFHEKNVFGGVSYARLNAPGRSYSQGVTSTVSDFSQIRILAGFGSPAQRGFGMAANAGLDLNFNQLQYGALQASYNWNCCGFNVEYRKYELGSVRNESYERFSFTLANIGSAGNLRRAERLF